jgi:ligand-binding SRPBCC domain-containing protein
VEYVWGLYFRDVNDSSRLIRHDHRHEFEAARRNGRDGTIVRDTFLYEVGGIPSPHLLHGLVAHPQVRAMFAYRQRRTEALLSRSQVGGPTES